jgi:hypothetical protein
MTGSTDIEVHRDSLNSWRKTGASENQKVAQMPTPAPPALRRQDGDCPSIPWDVITFRRLAADGSVVVVTIHRAKLARLIARRAAVNATKTASSFFGAITAVIGSGESIDAVIAPDAE